jgi:hypothetical protein
MTAATTATPVHSNGHTINSNGDHKTTTTSVPSAAPVSQQRISTNPSSVVRQTSNDVDVKNNKGLFCLFL